MTANAPSQSNFQAFRDNRAVTISHFFGDDLSPKAEKKLDELITQSLNGGSVESFFKYIVRILQQIATGKPFNAAHQEASDFSSNANIELAASTLCFKMKEAGRMDRDYAILAERAEAFTGMYETRADGKAYIPAQGDPLTLASQLRAKNNISTYVPEINSLNLRESQRSTPEIVRVAAVGTYPAFDTSQIGNPLPTPPGNALPPQIV